MSLSEDTSSSKKALDDKNTIDSYIFEAEVNSDNYRPTKVGRNIVIHLEKDKK